MLIQPDKAATKYVWQLLKLWFPSAAVSLMYRSPSCKTAPCSSNVDKCLHIEAISVQSFSVSSCETESESLKDNNKLTSYGF